MLKKRNILLLCLISIVFLLVVCFYIYYNNHNNSYVLDDQERGIDLNSFYDENSVEFLEEEIDIKGISYLYLQIDGLKKSKVENNVNKDIKNEVKKFITETGGVENFKIDVAGNFGNILSLHLMGEKEQKLINKFLNYNLVNGNTVTFNDLFTASAPIDNIVKENIYNHLASSMNCFTDDKNSNIKNSSDCKQIASKAEKYISLYDNHDFQFMFNNVCVSLMIEDKIFEIFYNQYPDYFNLHSKFLTNVSIYKNDKLGQKDILIASYRKNGIYSILDYQGDNTYVDSVVYSDEDVSEKIKSGIKNIMEKDSKALEGEEEFIFLNQEGYLSKEYDYYLELNQNEEVLNSQYSIYHFSLQSDLYYMNYEYFENNIKEQIYKAHRTKKMQNTNLINLAKNKNIHKEKANKEYIVLANGDILDDIEDLFISGYDYKQIIYDTLLQNYSIKEELLQDKLDYSYILYNENVNKAYAIVVKGKKFGECYIPFSTFDSKMMNIY